MHSVAQLRQQNHKSRFFFFRNWCASFARSNVPTQIAIRYLGRHMVLLTERHINRTIHCESKMQISRHLQLQFFNRFRRRFDVAKRIKSQGRILRWLRSCRDARFLRVYADYQCITWSIELFYVWDFDVLLTERRRANILTEITSSALS